MQPVLMPGTNDLFSSSESTKKTCKNTLSCYGKLKTRKEALQKLSRNPSTDLNCIFQSWQDQRHLKSWTHMEDMEFNSILVSRQTRVVLVHLRHVLLVSRLCICTHGRASTSSLTICHLLSLGLPLMMKEICGWLHAISLHCTVPHNTLLLKKKNMPCHWLNWVISPCRLLGSRDPSGLMLQKSSASPILGLTDTPLFARPPSEEPPFGVALGNTVSPPSSTSDLDHDICHMEKKKC